MKKETINLWTVAWKRNNEHKASFPSIQMSLSLNIVKEINSPVKLFYQYRLCFKCSLKRSSAFLIFNDSSYLQLFRNVCQINMHLNPVTGISIPSLSAKLPHYKREYPTRCACARHFPVAPIGRPIRRTGWRHHRPIGVAFDDDNAIFSRRDSRDISEYV